MFLFHPVMIKDHCLTVIGLPVANNLWDGTQIFMFAYISFNNLIELKLHKFAYEREHVCITEGNVMEGRGRRAQSRLLFPSLYNC